MRLLIAQGPGYYGVNIRLITEATYERLLADPRYNWWAGLGDSEAHEGDEVHSFALDNNTTLIMTQPIADDISLTATVMGFPLKEVADVKVEYSGSVGFDTGWWSEGEKAIEEALK